MRLILAQRRRGAEKSNTFQLKNVGDEVTSPWDSRNIAGNPRLVTSSPTKDGGLLRNCAVFCHEGGDERAVIGGDAPVRDSGDEGFGRDPFPSHAGTQQDVIETAVA